MSRLIFTCFFDLLPHNERSVFLWQTGSYGTMAACCIDLQLQTIYACNIASNGTPVELRAFIKKQKFYIIQHHGIMVMSAHPHWSS